MEVTTPFCGSRATLPRVGLRVAAALCGVVGGLAWISALIFDRARGGPAVDVLTWTGMFLLGVATVSAGASLVSSSAFWLRILVAACFAMLVGSVLALLSDSVEDLVVYAAFGAVAVVASVVALARTERAPGGSHAR